MKTYAQRLMELEKTYTPESRFFTTAKEMETVKTVLGLADLNDFELQNMRDMAVMFFNSKADNALLNDEKDGFDRLWNIMQSVTAVIDNVKWNRGLAV